MKFTGRIYVVTFMLIMNIFRFIYNYFIYGIAFDIITIPLVITLIPFGYWVGKQYDKAKYYSEKDTLTGAFNRRFIESVIPKLMGQVERNNDVLSISLIDIDNFKAINDTYGHQKGDEVVVQVANALQSNTRKGDVVGRWGGDEFLLIAHFTGTPSPEIVFKRLEQYFMELSKELQIDINISFGTAIYLKNGSTFNELLKKADDNMYKMKLANKKKHNSSMQAKTD